ncbi:repeat protein [Moumouvirus goulette]|uniref:Repeat protein n=1 Tax=Moumouvirus goulette TaxID=1247379 RepID=M1NLY6_9VIRU|nr:repeat protein [Moumouvirus goulette]AGF85020.1 repeat protein [Moumouvirus goulette]
MNYLNDKYKCNKIWDEIIGNYMINEIKFINILHNVDIDTINNIIYRLYYSRCFNDYIDITCHEFIKGNIKPNDNTIFVIAECGLIKFMEAFRDLGYDIKTKSTYLNAAFKIACKFRQIKMIKWLIENDFDINFDPELFNVACYHDDTDVCKTLLELGFHVDITKNETQELLIYILKNKKMDLIDLFIKHNINFNPLSSYINNLPLDQNNEKIINVLTRNYLTPEDIIKIFI